MSETSDLGPVDRIPPGEGRTFEVAGHRVAVFRTRAGRVFATQASCPHRQGPLADGLVGDERVLCPLHGFEFDLPSGACIGRECAALATYPVTLDEDGRIHLRIGPARR